MEFENNTLTDLASNYSPSPLAGRHNCTSSGVGYGVAHTVDTAASTSRELVTRTADLAIGTLLAAPVSLIGWNEPALIQPSTTHHFLMSGIEIPLMLESKVLSLILPLKERILREVSLTDEENEVADLLTPEQFFLMSLCSICKQTTTLTSLTEKWANRKVYVQYDSKNNSFFKRNLSTRFSYAVGGTAITLASTLDSAFAIPALAAALITRGKSPALTRYAFTSLTNFIDAPYYLYNTLLKIVHPSW